jgi:type IV secretory pathway TraG/TraD family ATPase VirD4
MLDEAGNVASLRSFDTLVSTAAGSGIQVVSVFHDLSQMVTLYGESRATSAFNNHSAVVILPGTRDETLRRLVNDDPRTLPTGTALLINENLPPQTIRLNR